DEVDPTFGADSVDNLPVGLVAIIGASSAFSRALVEAYEDVFDTADLARFTKTGFAFGSRLTQEARTLRIADPRIRQNVKDWTDQCIWLPYLKTNIGGKRESARTSDDLISWVEANGHPSLGTYWRNEDGSQTYRTCKVSAPLIREAMTAQGQRGFSALGAKLFGFRPEGVDMNGFKPIMQEAWQMISKSTKSASQQVQQMMVVNAQKEAFDDSREKFKYPRLHPELISMNAARALETQGMTGMMSALTSSVTMPLLQATMIGLLCMLFVVIVGFYFMPGGITKFWLFVKLMFSFQLWPVLSSMLNALSLFWLKKSSEDALQGIEGFTIATTSGLSDAAWSIGSWVAGMQLMVPVLAWGVVSGSPYVMSTIVGGLTSGLQGLSSKYAGEAADGNVSMGNQNFFNETVASRSVAQQNHVGSSGFAGTLNTGSQTITNAVNGENYTAQNTSQLATAFSSNESLSATADQNARQSEQLMHSNAKSFNDSVSDTTSNVESLLEKRAQGVNVTEGLNEQDSASFNKTLDEIQSSTAALKRDHNINAQTAINASIGFDSSKSLVGGAASKILGVKGGVDSSGQAINSEGLNKALSSDEGKRLSQSLSKLGQYSKTMGGQMINSTGKDATSTISNSLANAQTSADSLSRSYTASQNWEKMKSFSDSHGLTIQSNENDAWLNHVSTQTGLNKADAAEFVRSPTHAVQTAELRDNFVSHQKAELQKFVAGSDHVLSDREIANWKSHVPTVNQSGGKGRELVQGSIAKQGFMSHESLQKNYDLMGHKTEAAINSNAGAYERGQDGFRKAHAAQGNKFTQENNKTNARRLVSKGIDDTVSTFELNETLNKKG
ncbi:MAG: conjugal transfer protein TraG N-terminal domain-containing protein, partial [Simkaniaceae bacterium]|nr:conjugal transfer protein TraG N-terminal domain-containing protein [Simkaniaceae bacterium]